MTLRRSVLPPRESPDPPRPPSPVVDIAIIGVVLFSLLRIVTAVIDRMDQPTAAEVHIQQLERHLRATMCAGPLRVER
jgi:hypothetical protein